MLIFMVVCAEGEAELRASERQAAAVSEKAWCLRELGQERVSPLA
jgi:hypothetical protein